MTIAPDRRGDAAQHADPYKISSFYHFLISVKIVDKSCERPDQQRPHVRTGAFCFIAECPSIRIDAQNRLRAARVGRVGSRGQCDREEPAEISANERLKS